MSQQTKWSQFGVLISVFFFWGFVAASNDILIPVFKEKLHLEQWQSQMVSFAFYVAYTVGSIIYFLISKAVGGDVLNKIGYKNGISLGLIISALGTLLFYPAAENASFNLMITGLFIVGLGFSLQQTAANPLAIVMGDPKTGSQRLSLAGGINNFGTTIGPLIVSFAIFGSVASGSSNASIESIKTPYLILGAVLLLIAIVFALTKLPNIQHKETGKQKSQNIFHALKHKHLAWAVVAQFFYVGAQVCVFSLFILYATKSASVSEVKAADYLGACGIAFLIGRFLGTFLMKYIKPSNLLAIYAFINILLCIIAIAGHGMITVYAVILICFFMSIMFPTIFALGISDLGGDTEYGSSLVIMSIVGGAVLPQVFGWISDATGNIQLGYIVPLVCFVIVAWFGWRGFKVVNTENKML